MLEGILGAAGETWAYWVALCGCKCKAWWWSTAGWTWKQTFRSIDGIVSAHQGRPPRLGLQGPMLHAAAKRLRRPPPCGTTCRRHVQRRSQLWVQRPCPCCLPTSCTCGQQLMRSRACWPAWYEWRLQRRACGAAALWNRCPTLCWPWRSQVRPAWGGSVRLAR